MNPLATVGRFFIAFLQQLGELTIFAARALSHCVSPPFYFRHIGRQMLDIGYFSLPVVGLTALFTGMVLALQSYTGFARFSAEGAVATVVVLSITRELGPVIAGLMVAGRIGASIAAEIGTMRVTEQIDALETLSFDPVGFLALPRLLAALVMLPALTVLANATAIFSAWATLVIATDVRTDDFLSGLRLAFTSFQVIYSLIKAFCFGAAIAFVCSYQGYVTEAGAEGVGRSTATAVVIASVSILVLDAIVAAVLAPFIQA
jgi:phospholipid/cholesterol/gamma-HCH transport system permease protein